MPRVGLIAGNGRFPILFARTVRSEGTEVVAVAHTGETLTELGAEVESVNWIKVGEIGKMIATFKSAGIDRAVMAGGIHKAAFLEHFAPDERGMQVLARLPTLGDDALLRGLAAELESEGIQIVDSSRYLGSILTPIGPLTSRAPSDDQWKDIRFGVEVAKGIGRWDVGQTVVVKSRIVLAVEAIEGTDATIQRAGRPGAVVVKVSKPQQDMRFDVPAIGPRTVAVCRAAQVAVVALEAGRTLLLDKEALLDAAVQADLCMVGIEP
jgi:DUF1009 family protein